MLRQSIIVIFVLVCLILGAMFAFDVFDSKKTAEEKAAANQETTAAIGPETTPPATAPAADPSVFPPVDTTADTPAAMPDMPVATETAPAEMPEPMETLPEENTAAAPMPGDGPVVESVPSEEAVAPSDLAPPAADATAPEAAPSDGMMKAPTDDKSMTIARKPTLSADAPVDESAPAPTPVAPKPEVKHAEPAAAVSSAATKEERLTDRVIGSPNAPITVIEYASLTCPHCATFNKDILPQVKKDYVDTGKVKFIMRDLPTSPIATKAALLTRCVKPDLYKNYVDALFSSQGDWLVASDPLAKVKTLGKQLGLNDTEMQSCLDDSALLNKVAANAKEASDTYKINATPSFVVFDKAMNKGATISGKQDYAKFKQTFDGMAQ